MGVDDKALVDGLKASSWPRLRSMITSCCQMAAMPDTRALLAAADAIAPGILYCTLGCHPHNYQHYSDAFESKLLQELERDRRHVVAWGECGLDYFKNSAKCDLPESERI